MRLDESTRDGGEVNAPSAVKRRKVPVERAAAVSIAGEGANGRVIVAGGVAGSLDMRARIVFASRSRRRAGTDTSILSLKDEFLKKRKKGKLPAAWPRTRSRSGGASAWCPYLRRRIRRRSSLDARDSTRRR